MSYTRKTRDVYEVQTHTGYEFECVFTAETMKEAREILKDYRENEPQYSHRIVKRREKIAA